MCAERRSIQPAEASLDYYAHGAQTRPLLQKLARTEPTTLACMHGAAWAGDGAKLLEALADRVAPE